MSMSAWINMDNQTSANYNSILDKGSSTSNDIYSLRLKDHDSDGIKEFFAYIDTESSGGKVEIPLEPKDDAWYHFMAVYDGTNFTVYINNSLKGFKDGVGGYIRDGSGSPVGVGARDGEWFFNGTIDQPMIDADAWNSTERQNVFQYHCPLGNCQTDPPQFNSSSVTPDPPLIGQYANYSAEVYDPDGSIQYTNLSLSGVCSLSDEKRTGTTPTWDGLCQPSGEGWLNATFETVDDQGATSTAEIDRYLEDSAPTVTVQDPGNETLYGPENVTVTFDVSDSDSKDGETNSYEVWNNGDKLTTGSGTESYTESVNISAFDPQQNHLTVNVTDPAGNTNSSDVYWYAWYGVNLSLYDNATGDPLKNWTATFANDTESQSFTDQTNAELYEYTEIPTGSVNVTGSDGSSSLYYFNTTVSKTVANDTYHELQLDLEPKPDNTLSYTADPSLSVVEGTETTIECTAQEGTPNLFRDGVNVTNPTNVDTATLGDGIYVYNCTIGETANYAPVFATRTLEVQPGGFGCTSNTTYAFDKKVEPASDPYILDFKSLIESDLVRDDLADVNLTHGNLSAERNGTRLIVNHTQYSSNEFRVEFGNYLGNVSYNTADMPSSYNGTNVTSYRETNPYYVLTYLNEMTGERFVPSGANVTTSMMCSGGSSTFDVDKSDTRFVVPSLERVDELRTTVQYSSTDIYSRNLIVSSDVEYRRFWLVDANNEQVVELLFELRDGTGDFGVRDGARIAVKKYIDGSLVPITQQFFDAESKTVAYLVNNEKYSLEVSNDAGDVRGIGNLYVDTVDLTKTIRIGDIFENQLPSQNVTYDLYLQGNETIRFDYADPEKNTAGIDFTVYNYSGNERQGQLYTASTGNTSEANFNYQVPNVNGSYEAVAEVNHTVFGRFKVRMLTTPAIEGDFGDIDLGADVKKYVSVLFIFVLPLFFGAKWGAESGLAAVLAAGFLHYYGWYSMDAVGGVGLLAVLAVIAVLNIVNQKEAEVIG